VEVAKDCGTEAYLIDNASEVQERWLAGKRVVGISSGASAPEHLVSELLDLFRARGVKEITEVHVVTEDVRFMLPKPIREAVASAA
jgi:4-hydroxy-3-methylbut-2-enyl diphosphate reductase